MKIALVTMTEYNEIWAELWPIERFGNDAPTRVIDARVIDTLVLVRREEIAGEQALSEIKEAHARWRAVHPTGIPMPAHTPVITKTEDIHLTQAIKEAGKVSPDFVRKWNETGTKDDK